MRRISVLISNFELKIKNLHHLGLSSLVFELLVWQNTGRINLNTVVNNFNMDVRTGGSTG